MPKDIIFHGTDFAPKQLQKFYDWLDDFFENIMADGKSRASYVMHEVKTGTGVHIGSLPKITGKTSDGYHTFDELYDHRITLYIALCRILKQTNKQVVWRSAKHSDGRGIDDWFVLGIGRIKGAQITYHLPMSRWPETEFAETLELAPEFDGHTPADVLDRISKL